MKPLHLFCIAGLTASVLSFPAQPRETEEVSFWDDIKPGYYVEEAESGIMDCERTGDTRWFYASPERREGATIPDVFDMNGHIAFRFADGEERDYFLTSTYHVSASGYLGSEEQYREFFGNLSTGYFEGTALSGGGLGYTTGGRLRIRFQRNIDTGELYLTSATFDEYGRTQTWIASGLRAESGAIKQSGVWPDGTPTRVFHHCHREN